MVGAPILIDNVKYLCNVTCLKNAKGIITPYAITLKDGSGQIVEEEKKVVNNVSVHDNSNGNSAFGDNHHGIATTSQDANTPSYSNANLQKNNQTAKDLSQNSIQTESKNRKQTIRLTESKLRNIIREAISQIVLNESQESKSLDQAKKLYMQRMNASREDARDFISKLQHDIPALQHEAQKFTLGAARMFLDRQLTAAEDINRLNTTLRLLSKQYYDKFDRNLNSLSASQLIGQFQEEIQQNQANMRNNVEGGNYNGRSDYKIVPINSFEEAEEYGDYTDWCITHRDGMWKNYTKSGDNQVYFCLKNGFEQIPEQPTEGCPLDDYGLSMISVIVDEQGELAYCTSRWNHKQGGDADHIMNEKQISEVVGVNFYQTFKPSISFKEALENALQRLRSGESPKNVFSRVFDKDKYGCRIVGLKGKCNVLNQKWQIVSDIWFDDICDIEADGCRRVELNGKSNLLNQKWQIVSDTWFEYINFIEKDGCRIVYLNKKFNLINQKGQLVINPWLDYMSYIDKDGCRKFMLNGKWGIINLDRKIIFNNSKSR